MKEKGEQVTKGPGGKKVKLPNKNQKRVQILKGLMQKILSLKAWRKETFNGERLDYASEEDLIFAIESLKYDGKERIRQLIREHYLIPRSEATEDELATFYLCPSKAIYDLVMGKNKPKVA